MVSFQVLDPSLAPADAHVLWGLVRGLPAIGMYVQGAITEGLGAGLVRRHDALFNYVKGKAAAGESEGMAQVAARVNLFRGVLAEGAVVHVPAVEDLLYRHGPFLEAARSLSGLPLVVPDMLYVNVLLPGQELAIHTDTPEYRGLSKAGMPEWFLVVMHHSQLFEDWRVHIAGGVTFLAAPDQGGAFVLYPDGVDGSVLLLPPAFNTSVMLDADALFHGVERVGGPDAGPPPLVPGMTLHSVPGEAWEVRDGDRRVARYEAGDVRVSVQWKAHCFADEAARQAFISHADDLTVDQVLQTLVSDLRARGLVGSELPGDTALALLLMNTYIRFPEV
jgi:hypothetical protein